MLQFVAFSSVLVVEILTSVGVPEPSVWASLQFTTTIGTAVASHVRLPQQLLGPYAWMLL